ncbi:MAG: PEP-CTERM sorting domain-containing protein [Thermoguttaceae bacterium]|jgi:hypothetical protein
MRNRIIFLAVAMTLLFALPSRAGTITFGPYPDFAGYVTQTSSFTLPTVFYENIHIPFDGNITIGITDHVTVRVTTLVPVYVPSYVRIKILGDPEIVDPLSFFDIYAQDLDPEDPGTTLTGFNATNPELIPLSAETFIGVSGMQYPAPVQTVLVGDLAGLLPDFDLSAFSGANPNSIVYLAGPGNIPLADVPEPATLILLCCALFGFGGFAVVKRRR